MTPGLTGWAQINGRDNISIEKKVEIEKYYKENQSTLNLIFKNFDKCNHFLKVFKMHNH